MRYLFLLMLSPFVVNAEYSVSVERLLIKQKLFNKIDFSMDSAVVGVKKNWSNLALKLSYGKSTETANNLYVEDKFYTNKIDRITQVAIGYDINLNDNWTLSPFISYTDYKTTWKVNGVEPDWSKGADADTGYGLNLYYKYNDNYSMIFSVQDIYNKHKEGYGDEETYAFGFGFNYHF